MSDSGWNRVFGLFHELVELDQATRARRLAELEASDPDVAAQLAHLLAGHDHAGVLDHDPPEAPTGASPETLLGARVGPYVLEELLGVGGMGVVYRARQDEPISRRVALKLIRPGLRSNEVLQRFTVERRTLALMDHPNIARVLDAGMSDDGRPYVVMELVDGRPLLEMTDAERLSLRRRVELFLEVCRAVQHAHQKGIIHRDLKPTNVLVSRHDGRLIPKVIDFGIAKALQPGPGDDPSLTEAGYLLGTPEHMSPEQAAAEDDVDTRSDVYSLGVMLYELLAGRPPLDVAALRGRGYEPLRQAVMSQAPRPLTEHLKVDSESAREIAAARSTDRRTLRRVLRGDLRWVVRRALAKRRDDRYPSAAELAADLERVLADRATIAGPPGLLRRGRALVRRHRAAVAAAAAVLTGLVVAAVGLSVGLIRARSALELAEREAHRAEQVSSFLQDTLAGASPFVAQGRDTELLEDLLDDAARRVDAELGSQAEVAAELHGTLAAAYRDLGRYPVATDHARRAAELAGRAWGEEDPRTLRARGRLALALTDSGAPEDAVALGREVLAAQERVQGPDHPDTLTTANNLARVLRFLGRLDEAIPLFERVVSVRRVEPGVEARETLISMSNLAMALKAAGEPERAAALMREVVEVERRRHPDTPDAFISMDQYAGVLTDLGRLDEAEALLREALSGMRRVLGPEHPDTLVGMQTLGRVLGQRERWDAAIDVLTTALSGIQATLGADDPRAVFTGRELAIALQRTGHLDRSERRFLEARRAAAAAFPPDSPYAADLDGAYGVLLAELGRTDQAGELLERSVAGLTTTLGPDHPVTQRAVQRRELVEKQRASDVAEPHSEDPV